jgi:uncharacterized protein (DUF1330 family)
LQDGTDDIVSRLVKLHGEGGAAPTADDWRSILALPGAVPLLNLLKFREQANLPGGPISGAKAYARYSAAVAPAFARAGGERLFFGPVAHSLGPGDDADWDAAILTRYPSAQALAAMWLADDFVAAHANRIDALERSRVLIFGNG